jgi:hypothetical protein
MCVEANGADGYLQAHLTSNTSCNSHPLPIAVSQIYAEDNGADGYPVVQITTAMAVVIQTGSSGGRRRLAQLSARVPALLVDMRFSTLTVTQTGHLQVCCLAVLCTLCCDALRCCYARAGALPWSRKLEVHCLAVLRHAATCGRASCCSGVDELASNPQSVSCLRCAVLSALRSAVLLRPVPCCAA